ncbi:rhomboid family intramembrane serine protease [Nonlabens arenilitoris]|uniref:Rhomboid family intramembrane serine protease n=1 Tax=Nonlabens arenilitoris TaxID=1217969 RepID=A0A2S7U980_9FLAO|nr:rhomboid family intramembrane serine protease [Nonlabens arenilitoris]PQJ30832.1 rhomboid family intramembrane serine protease [Nonlabens arenilitoris]
MKDSQYFKFDIYTVLPALVFIILIWLVYTIEVKYHFNFTNLGIRPGKWSGLKGVIFSPFIHADLGHLWSNTLPSLVLVTALSYFYRSISFKVLCLGLIFSGLMTWIIGRPSYHIGASGLIYLLASFLFFKGVFTKHYRMLALSFVVTFFYGSMVWYVLPLKTGISWEGHLSGGVVGIILAIVTKNKLPEKMKYQWENPDFNIDDDPFMRQFDENGNFIELDEEE